jgi:hypothetical protein
VRRTCTTAPEHTRSTQPSTMDMKKAPNQKKPPGGSLDHGERREGLEPPTRGSRVRSGQLRRGIPSGSREHRAQTSRVRTCRRASAPVRVPSGCIRPGSLTSERPRSDQPGQTFPWRRCQGRATVSLWRTRSRWLRQRCADRDDRRRPTGGVLARRCLTCAGRCSAACVSDGAAGLVPGHQTAGLCNVAGQL